MTVIEAFAKNLKDTLEDRGWTQTELTRLSGVSRATISGLVCASYGPTLQTAHVIAKTLNVTIDDLLVGCDE